MASDTSVSASITLKNLSDEKIVRSLTNLSSTATDSQIYNLIEGLVGLTTNSLLKVEKVITVDISDGGKPVPSVTWQNPAGGSIAFSTLYQQLNSMKFTYCVFELAGATFAEGTIFTVESTFSSIGGLAVVNEDGYIQLQLGVCAEELDSTPKAGSFSVFIPETDSSSALTVVMTVTV